jgi:hypothetical protein
MHEEVGSPTEWQRNRLGGAPKRGKPSCGSPTFTRYPEVNLSGMSRAYPAEHHPVPEVLSGGCPRAMSLPKDGSQRAVLLGMSFCPGLNAAQHLLAHEDADQLDRFDEERGPRTRSRAPAPAVPIRAARAAASRTLSMRFQSGSLPAGHISDCLSARSTT